MHTDHTRRRSRRRGVTLVEMLVVVGLLLLLMSALVSVFQYAGQAVSNSRAYQQIDETLRRLDVLIRQDLAGVTAPLNPPIDPDDQKGYFELGENSFSDLQGEDTDDYISFTAKAPQGKPFTGRIWVYPFPNPNLVPGGIIPPGYPVTITSEYAEVVYFLRNGNLYRRVLLIVPDRAKSIQNVGLGWNGTYTTSMFGTDSNGNPLRVSWQGMNDISARPFPFYNIGTASLGSVPPPIPNSLGDLTNRQNRFARPRHTDDYLMNSTYNGGPSDGIPDDQNSNGAPDFYMTLYPAVFGTNLLNDPGNPAAGLATHDRMPFPFIFPGAYSQAEQATKGVGFIHSMDPAGLMGTAGNASLANHSPLLTGDSLPIPLPNQASTFQTWWCFPTWRETMSANWTDPVHQINVGDALSPVGDQSPGLSWQTLLTNVGGFAWLPPMTAPFRNPPQLFSDGVPQVNPYFFATPQSNVPDALGNLYWTHIGEDDLIATNVRSFDIKVYDPNVRAYAAVFPNDPQVQLLFTPGYYDLGYGSNPAFYTNPANAYANATSTVPATLVTLGHEGRMPPLQSDNRVDSQWPTLQANNGIIGDTDTSGATIRMRRVYDTWSTDYSNAPDVPINNVINGPPFAQPIYPSYPAPYPAPLRGIQIQIRMTDARSRLVKSLTIRQDFTENLH